MFLRNISAFVIANSYAQAVRFGQELVIRLMMTPEVVGIWSLILVIYNFGATFDSQHFVKSHCYMGPEKKNKLVNTNK